LRASLKAGGWSEELQGEREMKENPVRERSYGFALEVIRLHRELMEGREFDLSRQFLRSGTSIGANVEEALAGQSRRDFLAKMAIASKEARECGYWLRLLRDSGSIRPERIRPLLEECDALIRMLTAIVKTTRGSLGP
jgi:four helix bundle protein